MKLIPVGKLFTKVDDEDFEMLNQFKWHLYAPRGFTVRYAVRNSRLSDGIHKAKRRSLKMHRELFGFREPTPQLDHVDGDGLNNQRANLRICTPLENARNKQKRRDGISPFTGVSPFKKKWRARIRINGLLVHLGYFNDQVSAAKAYDKAASENFGAFARINFKQEEIDNGKRDRIEGSNGAGAIADAGSHCGERPGIEACQH